MSPAKPTFGISLFLSLVIGLVLISPELLGQERGNDSLQDLFQDQLRKLPIPSWSELPDPFLRSSGFVPESENEPEYKLEAILYDPENPQAVINGEILNVGDLLTGGRTLRVIGPNYVHLEKGRSLLELSLDNTAVKRVSLQINTTASPKDNSATPRKERQ